MLTAEQPLRQPSSLSMQPLEKKNVLPSSFPSSAPYMDLKVILKSPWSLLEVIYKIKARAWILNLRHFKASTRPLWTFQSRSSFLLHSFSSFNLSSCPTALLVVSLSLLTAEPAAADRPKVLAMVCLGWLINSSSYGSFLVLASQLSARMSPLLVELRILHQYRTLHSTGDSHTWPLSRPRLAADVREYGDLH